MAPIIPTHRPWFTPERAAIGVAVLSLLCSVFLAVDAARASPSAPDHGRDAAAAGCPAGAPAVIASPGGVQLL